MAEKVEQSAAGTSATPAKKTEKAEEVTLVNRDGVKVVTSDPSKIVDLEFNGYSRNPQVFKKNRK